jgi:hypothetical protein
MIIVIRVENWINKKPLDETTFSQLDEHSWLQPSRILLQSRLLAYLLSTGIDP